MPYRIEFGVRVPIRTLLNSAKSVEDEINDAMASFGFDEKLSITSIVPVVMTCDLSPTDEQMRQIRAIVEQEFRKHFDGAILEYARCVRWKGSNEYPSQ